MPDAPLKQVSVRVRNLYCPAVSHSCSFIFFRYLLFMLTSITLDRKSTPIVGVCTNLQFSSMNRSKMLVLPTAELPIITILARQSYSTYLPIFKCFLSFYIHPFLNIMSFHLTFRQMPLPILIYDYLIRLYQFNSMDEISAFQERLRKAVANMNNNIITETIAELKALEKEISTYLQINSIRQNDRLSEMQIAIFNNLACLFEKKGKYRSSLYHLQIAEELENKLFTHKYSQATMPLPALETLSTTYSNLSAIQSKLGDYKEAIQNAEFAIQILGKNERSKGHKSLAYLYYNYSFLLNTLGKYGESSKYATEGLGIAQGMRDKAMVAKYEQLIQSQQQKLAKKESRKLKQIKKYLKGQLGIVKHRKHIESQFLSKNESQQLNGSIQHHQRFSALKQYLNAEQKYFPAGPSRHNSTYTTLSNNRKIRNLSEHKNRQANSTIDEKIREQLIAMNKDVVRAELQSENTNRIQNKPKPLDFSGKIKRNKLNSSVREGAFQYRIKPKKLKLEQQIDTLNKKNETLQKIIKKIYSQKSHLP